MDWVNMRGVCLQNIGEIKIRISIFGYSKFVEYGFEIPRIVILYFLDGITIWKLLGIWICLKWRVYPQPF